MLKYDKLSRDNSAFRSFTGLSVEEFDSLYDKVESRYNRIKREGGTLTDTEKLFNKMLSRMRIVVEHVICRMKKYKIFGLRYRNRLRHYDLMTDIVSGLINMRIIGINI